MMRIADQMVAATRSRVLEGNCTAPLNIPRGCGMNSALLLIGYDLEEAGFEVEGSLEGSCFRPFPQSFWISFRNGFKSRSSRAIPLIRSFPPILMAVFNRRIASVVSPNWQA